MVRKEKLLRTAFRSLAAVLGLFLISSAVCRAQEEPHQLGVGAYIGTPFGLTAKYLIDHRNAADLAFGVQGGNFDFHADLLTHSRDLPKQPPQGKFVPYVGMGFKVEDQGQTLFGIRFLCGTAYIIQNMPLEAFAEPCRYCAWRRAWAPISMAAWACATTQLHEEIAAAGTVF